MWRAGRRTVSNGPPLLGFGEVLQCASLGLSACSFGQEALLRQVGPCVSPRVGVRQGDQLGKPKVFPSSKGAMGEFPFPLHSVSWAVGRYGQRQYVRVGARQGGQLGQQSLSHSEGHGSFPSLPSCSLESRARFRLAESPGILFMGHTTVLFLKIPRSCLVYRCYVARARKQVNCNSFAIAARTQRVREQN